MIFHGEIICSTARNRLLMFDYYRFKDVVFFNKSGCNEVSMFNTIFKVSSLEGSVLLKIEKIMPVIHVYNICVRFN